MPSLIGNKPNQVPSNGDLGTLAFQDSNAVNISGGTVDVSAGTAALPTLGTTGDPNTGVFFPAADTVAVATNGVEALRVDSSARLGVGIAPSAKLHSYNSAGGTSARLQTGTTANGNFLDYQNAAGTRQGIVGFIDSTNLYIHNDGAASIIFDTNNVERMRIHASGGVSIGNTTDAGAGNLSVTGSATIQGLTIGKGGGTVVSNTVLGRSALVSNLIGTDNTAIGDFSQNPSTGYLNTSVGSGSLRFNTTGGGNSAIGNLALYSSTTGSYNTAIGYNAGNTNTTGNNNTYLGSIAVGSANNNTNETVIGYNAVGLGSNTTVIGNSSTTATKLFGSVTATGLIYPQQAATAPTYVKGAIYFDTTLNKLRVGGATGWETITSV